MATAYARGYKIYYHQTDGLWRYTDNNQPLDNNRACKRCGRKPLAEGYDACLGHIPRVVAACCGHGRDEYKYVMQEGDNQ